MPSQAYTSFLHMETFKHLVKLACQVSMPSRAYTSFLHWSSLQYVSKISTMCQCPLGLIPHFYWLQTKLLERGEKSVNALSGLYLISTADLSHIILLRY